MYSEEILVRSFFQLYKSIQERVPIFNLNETCHSYAPQCDHENLTLYL